MKLRKLMSCIAGAGVALSVSTSAFAVPVQWTTGTGANGHWYEFFASTGVTWNAAMAAAPLAAAPAAGLTGYLATVTSQQENDFLFNNTNAGGPHGNRFAPWISGSDAGNEGVWTWRAGPEIGQVFWNGGAGGSAPPGAFENWTSGEPNNCCGGENYLQFNFGSNPTDNGWNDLNVSGNTVNSGLVSGYIVEWSVVPEPISAALVGLGLLGLGWSRRKP